jgi:hypothetical protein
MNETFEPDGSATADVALADAPPQTPSRTRRWLVVPAALGIVGGTLLAVDTLLPTDHRPQAVAARQVPPSTTTAPAPEPPNTHPIDERLERRPVTVGTIHVELAVRGLVQDHAGPFPVPAQHLPGYERRARLAQTVDFDPPGGITDDWHQPTYNICFEEGLTEQEIDDYRVGNEAAGGRVVDGMFVLTEPMDSSLPDSPVWTSVGFSPGPGRFFSVHGRNIDEDALIEIARSVSLAKEGGRR